MIGKPSPLRLSVSLSIENAEKFVPVAEELLRNLFCGVKTPLYDDLATAQRSLDQLIRGAGNVKSSASFLFYGCRRALIP